MIHRIWKVKIGLFPFKTGMTPDRWKQIESLYHAALEMPEGRRSAFLAEVCAGDAALHDEVASLIFSHEQAGAFIESTPDDVIAGMLADQQARAMLGRTLGHYRIVSLVGAGGMGEVYRARDTKLDRDVAVKILPARLAGDPEALRRFEREAKVVAALSHPNILSIYDFGSDQGVSYAVMELLEGETLRERLNRSAVDWREAVGVGIAIAEGLSAAHARGVTHRDLKPENIFLTADGQIKILDFGLARMKRGFAPEALTLTSAFTQTTSPGLIMGTVGYMSPEQVRGEKVEVSSDIFSFGCVLYETLSRRRPFGQGAPAEVIAAILKEEPPPLRDAPAEIPAELERIVRKALRKAPGERYPNAVEARDDLKNTRLESELKDRLKRSEDQTAPLAPSAVTASAPTLHTAGRPPSKTQDHKPSDLIPRGTGRMLALWAAALVIVSAGWGLHRIWIRDRARAVVNVPKQAREEGVEALRYFLEMDAAPGSPARSTGEAPIGGQKFRFHFVARAPGYLYIVALEDNNIPTTFLTARPVEAFGAKTNFVEAGKDFAFPSGDGASIGLGDYGNTTMFTVIFSPAPLRKPKFLAAPAHRRLTTEEQGDLASLWRRHGGHSPNPVVKEDGGGESVVILSPADGAGDQPVVFHIELKRL
jgi:serine/threonine protein kinase